MKSTPNPWAPLFFLLAACGPAPPAEGDPDSSPVTQEAGPTKAGDPESSGEGASVIPGERVDAPDPRWRAAHRERLEQDRIAVKATLASSMDPESRAEWLGRVEAASADIDPSGASRLQGTWPWIDVGEGFVSMGDVHAAHWFAGTAAERAAGSTPRGLDFERADHPIHGIVDLQRQLEAKGVDLLLVPIPTRLQLEPELFETPERVAAGLPAPLARGPSLLWLELIDRGVEVLDPLPTLLRRQRGLGGRDRNATQRFDDPHWSPLGCRLTAELLADRLRSYPWYEAGEVFEGTHFTRGEVSFEYQPHRALVGRMPAPRTWRFEAIRPRDIDRDRPRSKSSPVLLLSDSQSTVYEERGADFVRHLWASAQLPIDAISIVDGAPRMSRQAWFRRPAPLSGKRLVVWMFSTREFVREARWGPLALPE